MLEAGLEPNTSTRGAEDPGVVQKTLNERANDLPPWQVHTI